MQFKKLEKLVEGMLVRSNSNTQLDNFVDFGIDYQMFVSRVTFVPPTLVSSGTTMIQVVRMKAITTFSVNRRPIGWCVNGKMVWKVQMDQLNLSIVMKPSSSIHSQKLQKSVVQIVLSVSGIFNSSF